MFTWQQDTAEHRCGIGFCSHGTCSGMGEAQDNLVEKQLKVLVTAAPRGGGGIAASHWVVGESPIEVILISELKSV